MFLCKHFCESFANQNKNGTSENVCARNGARRFAAVLPDPAFLPFFILLPAAILFSVYGHPKRFVPCGLFDG